MSKRTKIYDVLLLLSGKFQFEKYFSWTFSVFIFLFSLLNLFYLLTASDKSAGHVMLMDQSAVAYGGILNELSPTAETNDSDVADVVRFAVQYADEFHPTTVPKAADGKIVDPIVSNLKKLKLQATKDGKNQHYLMQTTFVEDKQQFQRRKVIYGMTYSFCLTWKNVANPHKHNFVVSLDRERNRYIFEHTFSRDGGTISSVSSSDSHQECRTIPIATDELTASSQSECLQGDNGSPIDQSKCLQVDGGSAIDQSQCKSGTEGVWNFKRKTDAEADERQSSESDLKKVKLGEERITLLTQNIWNFNGIPRGSPWQTDKAYTQRMSRLGELIASMKADVIAFQEVRFDVTAGGHLGPCQVLQLARHLPKYQFVYQPAVNYVPDSLDRSEEGLAVFSLHPILSRDYILLSRDMNDEEDKLHQRICLRAEIETPYLGIIHVFVTHLSLSEAARERSVLEIWKYMTKFPKPAVLLGDLNAHPQSRAVRFLQGDLEISGVKTEGLKDAWLMMNKEPRAGPRVYAKDERRDSGLTFSTLNERLSERIDYIFVRLPGNMQMTNISLVDSGGRGPMAASDHLGLQASISVTGP